MDQLGKASKAQLPLPGCETLRVHLCGALRLTTADGAEIRIKSVKGRALLARLCLDPHGRTSRSAIGSMLWSDSKAKSCRKGGKPAATPAEPYLFNLRQELAKLKASLGEHSDVITADTDDIRIDLNRVWTDTRAVLQQIAAGETLGPNIDQRALLSEFRPVSPEFDEWIEQQRREFRQQKQNALAQRAARSKAFELTLDQRIAEYNKLFDFDESGEEVCRDLMLALMQKRRLTRARWIYQRCRAAVLREFDCEPEPATTDLYNAIVKEIDGGGSGQSGAVDGAALPLPAIIVGDNQPILRPKPYVEPIYVGLRPVANETGDPAIDGIAEALNYDLAFDLPQLMGPLTVVELPPATLHISDLEAKCRFVIDMRLCGAPDELESSLRLAAKISWHGTENGISFRKLARSYRTEFVATSALHDPGMLSSRVANQIFLLIASEWSDRHDFLLDASRSPTDLALAGYDRLARANVLSNVRDAQHYFSLALQRDRRDVEALVGLAHVCHRLVSQPSFTDDAGAVLRQGLAYIERALELAPNHARANYISGMLCSIAGQPKKAASVFEKVVRLTRMPTALCYKGYNRVFLGDPVAGRADIRKSLVGLREESSLHILHMFDGTAAFHCGDLSGAIEAYETSLDMAPQYGSSRLWLSGMLQLAGKQSEARSNMEKFRAQNPTFRITDFDATWGEARSRNEHYLSRTRELVDALKRLELPQA